ncbi:hypothetical protein [Microbacterium sp. SD291]|uniref:hypothetical protein n=1 Tax=Microbacterium sp. SD291 TaxID=2782007 RepID=UPI001A9622D6|nr:hypothetical protein [Microbacterium sp. SD291]MBO0981298.1 hypothetical protein [Microbacterium sp. SD291]
MESVIYASVRVDVQFPLCPGSAENSAETMSAPVREFIQEARVLSPNSHTRRDVKVVPQADVQLVEQ